jgi:hypothetical protein
VSSVALMSPARAKYQCTTNRRKYQQQVANINNK